MIAYAALDEMTQPLVNRYAAFDDWLGDVVGAAGAVMVLELGQWLGARFASVGKGRQP